MISKPTNSVARSVPPAVQAQLWIDFDGTISSQDVLDELICRYAIDDSWKLLERRWQSGEIGSRACLTGQFDLVRVTPSELDAILNRMTLDPGAVALFRLLDLHRVPVVILSDCVDFFIRRILRRYGFAHLEVRSNTAVFADGGLRLYCPHESCNCTFGAAHCKCASMDALGQPGRRSIYVGDGRSDLCASRKADLVFAKAVLGRLLESEKIPFLPYTTLHDVAATLSHAWQTGDTSGAAERRRETAVGASPWGESATKDPEPLRGD
jgi:2,3-diketo-5-methylthio-1-phosphopentane phosphatase